MLMWDEEKVIKINSILAAHRNFTVDYINRIPDDVRAEIIDGQLLFTATPPTIHQYISGEIFMVLYGYLRDQSALGEVFVRPFGIRLVNDRINHFEPDLFVTLDLEKIGEDGCYGAPDLIIEIVSKCTRERDYGIKVEKYREIGVKEYWIVDPIRETVMVYWFEDEEQNCLYSLQDEIEFHLFQGLKVKLAES